MSNEAMRRRDFIRLWGSSALAWPLAVRAQEAGRTYRVGGLSAEQEIETPVAG
jgi:hypothetical protein